MAGKDAITQSKIIDVLDWAYEKAVDGVSGLGSAAEMAHDYTSKNDDLDACANSLIRWQNSKAGASGFVTGLGGLITLPVAIPANIASVLYVQIRMVSAIAHMGGYDLKSDQVKSMVYLRLVGTASIDILKDVGIKVGTKFTNNLIKNMSMETIKSINKKVGFLLVTKAGSTGVVNLTKMVPLLGGVVGGTFDSITTNAIGNIAKKTFLSAPAYTTKENHDKI